MVDCAGDSPASDAAVVVVPFFGHVDGEERTLGDFGVGGASASSTLGSCVGDLTLGQRAQAEDGERYEGFSGRKLSASAPTAAMPAGTVTLLGAPLRLPSPR